jgi:hypothetical protein
MCIAFEFITGVQVGIEFAPEVGIHCILNLGVVRIWFVDINIVKDKE